MMTPTWSRRIPFKVDVGGVIELMGKSLYSRADTPIRELIQNAHDAIARRRARDLTYRGRIDIEQDAAGGVLHFHDDGIGLCPQEAEEYLSTLGISLTGLLRNGLDGSGGNGGEGLIGQFGIGLFSAFMLADRLVIESRKVGEAEAVRWEAGVGTDIELSSSDRTETGTSVTVFLKPEHRGLAELSDPVEAAIKEYADFLTVPIFLNRGKARVNVIEAAWFEATPDRERLELELEARFGETPLDVVLFQVEKPASVRGALYVTPQRVPGFAGDPAVTVTVRRMVISRQIQELLPPWAGFVRGVLELSDCLPTTSRENLVRDVRFEQVRKIIETQLYEHFERLATKDPQRWESVVGWHRYTLTGAALDERRLRDLLRRTYRLPTSRGPLTFEEILAQSPAEPLTEAEAEHVIWYNADRRQELWLNTLFAGQDVPCVHALRGFEETLLATWAADTCEAGTVADVRMASPSAANFANVILGVTDMDEAPAVWQEHLACTGARILLANFRGAEPVMAFLNERYELQQTFDELKKQGDIPAGFQRLIDAHFGETPASPNEVLLNRNHRLVARAMEQSTRHPLAGVLRLLVCKALTSAGAGIDRAVESELRADLDWIAEALWGKKS
jgi:hypothetical protein